jgi:hypothetical protein
MNGKEIIQGLWVGKSLSLMEIISINSFLANGHIYHLYIYDKVQNVPNGCIIKDENEILPSNNIFKYEYGDNKGSYAGFANLFRLKLLLKRGGIWSDLDVVCLKYFDFKEPYLFSSEFNNNTIIINNTIIKVPVSSQIIADCYREAQSMKIKQLSWRMNGSDLLAKYIHEYNMAHFISSPDTFCPINWWEWSKFIEDGFDIKIIKTSYAIHLWHEMWRRDTIENKRFWFIRRNVPNKNKLYSPKTLYGYLQRMYI